MRAYVVVLAISAAELFGSATANAQYRASASYMSMLNSSSNWNTYKGTTYLVYNATTKQLPNAKPQVVAVPLAPATQVGKSDVGLPPGQCVSFARPVCGAPPTGANGENWFRGTQVVGSQTLPGTLIATFQWNGRRWVYGGHAAIFAGFGPNGTLLVWDQNWGVPFVRFHAITGNNGGITDPRRYFVVK